MATLASINREIELSLRLIKKSLDPFQVDLEWFEYDLAIVLRRSPDDAPSISRPPERESHIERHAIRGKFNRSLPGAFFRATGVHGRCVGQNYPATVTGAGQGSVAAFRAK